MFVHEYSFTKINTPYYRAFNYRVSELAKAYSFSNNHVVFESFRKWYEEIIGENNLDNLIIGVQPIEHCKDNDLKAVLVNQFHIINKLGI
jgi:hypothetical protein